MAEQHPFRQQFIDLMATTQSAYEQRRQTDYITAFAEDYYSVQLNTSFAEDKQQLAAKIARDVERFDLLQMDFEVKRVWFTGDTGFAHLGYFTRLRFKDSQRVIVDKRENLITGRHTGDGSWELTGKIVLKAQNYLEEDSSPDI